MRLLEATFLLPTCSGCTAMHGSPQVAPPARLCSGGSKLAALATSLCLNNRSRALGICPGPSPCRCARPGRGGFPRPAPRLLTLLLRADAGLGARAKPCTVLTRGLQTSGNDKSSRVARLGDPDACHAVACVFPATLRQQGHRLAVEAGRVPRQQARGVHIFLVASSALGLGPAQLPPPLPGCSVPPWRVRSCLCRGFDSQPQQPSNDGARKEWGGKGCE